jgi:hypothetical protein
VEVARVEGVAATALALGLDRGRLARRMRLIGSASEEAARESDGFVEIDARRLCSAGKTVLRLEGRDGERFELELSATPAFDVVELARAFWSRPR